jgi:uncharacterized membrane protein
MMLAAIVLGAPDWLVPALIAVAVMLVIVIWAYWRSGSSASVRTVAGLLKVLGIVALALCLIEPLLSGMRPRPGENLFILLADNSRSLQIYDQNARAARGELAKTALSAETSWQTRLSQDFDVRRYQFDARMRPVEDFSQLNLDGNRSVLANSLATLARRYRGRANAGILLFTDGNATDIDAESLDWQQLPPVYPVMLGQDVPLTDIGVTRVSVSQTNFEATPVTVLAEIDCHGYAGQAIVTLLLDESGKELQRHVVNRVEDGKPVVQRFQFRPEQKGISFFRVRAFAKADEKYLDRPGKTSEATTVNNDRLVMVDRGSGPYRVLYVSGRPNWEFKFLRRAMEEDEEVDLVGLVRIAKREPKFNYRGRQGETTNPLFRGFGNQEDEQAEQYDQPVLLRLGTVDKEELRDGFPQAADQLFRYHAVMLDDVDAEFFTQDQMSLVQDFVSQRGGGLLMLGGQESFVNGKFDRTPIGELLPVYLDRFAGVPVATGYQWSLTRDGWLQPWARMRATEQEERGVLERIPRFKTVNRVRTIKPGATVIASVKADEANEHPALVVQRFGEGRSAALLVGDMWKWNMRRKESEKSDLETSWRQMVRWLVADVPQRVQVETQRKQEEATAPVQLNVRVFDETFKPLDNAQMSVHVTTPEGKEIELTAAPSDELAGTYETSYVPRTPGAYRARVDVTGADGNGIGQRQTGWTSDPSTDEFQQLRPNKALLEDIATKTGGEMVPLDDLNGFVRSLPNRKIPIVEPWISPLWHRGTVFLFAIACLIAEWGLRRWHGLA